MHNRRTLIEYMLATATALAASSCVNVHVDPIYAKVDINIKVDQELDSFFQTVAAKQTAAPSAPASAPVTQPAGPPPEPTSPAAHQTTDTDGKPN